MSASAFRLFIAVVVSLVALYFILGRIADYRTRENYLAACAPENRDICKTIYDAKHH